MEENIKVLEEYLKRLIKNSNSLGEVSQLSNFDIALDTLIEGYKKLDKDNNDLRRLYRRTAIKLKENGKEELADYFLAQINEVPTFTVDDDIDYYEEYYKQKEKIKELEGMLKNRIKYTNELEKDLFENCANYVIPKSKVKEKIEAYKKNCTVINSFIVEVLEELLEGKYNV